MNDVCTVLINGDEWIIPCDRVNDLGVDSESNLVNLTSSSLTLYKNFSESTQSQYPRIVCNFGRVCYYQEQAQSYDYYTNINSLEIKNRSITDDLFITFFLGIIAIGVVLWNFFRH